MVFGEKKKKKIMESYFNAWTPFLSSRLVSNLKTPVSGPEIRFWHPGFFSNFPYLNLRTTEASTLVEMVI